nr:PDR ABC-type transporter family protein [Tanacetum cinerariifolium]
MNTPRKMLEARESRPHASEGQSNDVHNHSSMNDNTDETIFENIIKNLDNPSNGRKQVHVVNRLLDKSSECSREITKIFKERIDDKGYTWIKASQPPKSYILKNLSRDKREGSMDTKASGRYADFFRDIRGKMVKPIFTNDNTWTNLTSYWETSKYKETLKKSSGVKRRNLCGVGSKSIDYIKDIDSGNKTTGITKVNDKWEKKYMKMERKINKLNKTLEIVCNRFNITLPDCDFGSENTDEGDAYQGPNISHSRAGEINKGDHDSFMIMSK